MARFTKIPETTFQNLQINAGVILSTFTPDAPPTEETMLGNILFATTGGNTFTATPSYTDFGEDIDGCPDNMKEFKKLGYWDVKLSGTALTVDTATAKKLIGGADVSGNKVTPRSDILDSDFSDIWLVADYSDKNGETNGGFIAIHMMNTLSTGGFSLQTSDKAKGQFAYEFTAHYSMSAQATVPFEVYIKAGTAEGA